jgi:hypothetical protein
LSSWITLAAATTTFTGSNGFVSAIAFDGSKWVAGGSNYGHMAYSTDGTTWTGITETEEIFNGWINGLAYGGGKFVAVGNINNLTGIAWANASDITKWTAVAVTPFPDATFTEIGAIAYGNGYFVAIGSSSSAAAYSPDGITWTKIVDTKFGTNAINGITYGNGKFVIVGGDGTIAYSVPE